MRRLWTVLKDKYVIRLRTLRRVDLKLTRCQTIYPRTPALLDQRMGGGLLRHAGDLGRAGCEANRPGRNIGHIHPDAAIILAVDCRRFDGIAVVHATIAEQRARRTAHVRAKSTICGYIHGAIG